MTTDDEWVTTLMQYTRDTFPPRRDAAIRALWIHHNFTVEDINEACSVDLAVIRHALLNAPVVKDER